MRGRTRRLLAVALAVAVVVALVVVDSVTLTRAKPSFDNETRSVDKSLQSTSTTAPAKRTTTRPTIPAVSRPGTAPTTLPTGGSGSGTPSTGPASP